MMCALISDVHGNRWALEAVLDDIAKRGVRTIHNLGDSVYGPLQPHETVDLLRSHCSTHILGNQDRILGEPRRQPFSATLEYCLDRLSDGDLLWIGESHKAFVQVDSMLLVHGTPRSDSVYLLEEISHGLTALRSESSLVAELERISSRIVLCGHSHTQRFVRIGDRTVINPGSVGLQAFTDEVPFPHGIENGSPDARYAILDIEHGAVHVQNMTVPYDFREAVAYARRNGRDDWAHWLEYGRA